MRIACVQVATIDGKTDANRVRALRLAEQALANSPDLVILPELVTTGYCTDDYTTVAENTDGTTVRAFSELAASSGACIAIGLVTLTAGGRPQNGSVLVGPHGLIGTYAKSHMCVNDDPRVDESTAFARGETLGLFDFAGVRIGVMICYDGQHGELPIALVAGGADLLIWLNNRTSMPVWEAAAIARFNRVPVAAVNRVGEAGWQPAGAPPRFFTGISAVVDHEGEIIAAAHGGEETVIVGDVDIEAGRRRRNSHVLNTMRSRRPDLYALA
ncbi:MAG: carbon-nitrogen hydrolase family protein [Chloroflexota bacterium]|nr:carbon-nitrogen hydrolase family protein [Chloroflexota bacterium]MDE2918990.1 carbon-nitrogen hydrolase family protein [Chloroflexota bacterium]